MIILPLCLHERLIIKSAYHKLYDARNFLVRSVSETAKKLTGDIGKPLRNKFTLNLQKQVMSQSI